MISAVAKALAKRTDNAYSFSRYRSWGACAGALLKMGLNDREAEAVLRSKWMRWAGDATNKPYGQNTAKDIVTFINKMSPDELKRSLNDLVLGTFA